MALQLRERREEATPYIRPRLSWSHLRLQAGISIIYLYILSCPFLAASAKLRYSCCVLSVTDRFGQGRKKAVLNGAL